jgi:AcrR family transcriptional regulator
MRRGDETKERIVHRAMALAARDGFDGLSIGALAEDMHLSKSGLISHFGSKDELQLSVLEHAASEYRAAVLTPAVAAAPGEPQIRMLFDRWLAWAADQRMIGGCVLIAAAQEYDDKPGPQRDRVAEMHQTLLHTIAGFAKAAVDSGHFRKDLDPQQLAHDIYALVVGYHVVHRLLRERSVGKYLRSGFDRLLADARA